jgi:succinate dehydrogenase/fumarate reductase flavoprotein subunit
MYENITGENAYKQPMRIFPAVHYTMGGLWVDYNLQCNIPGLFVLRRSQLLRPRRQPPRRFRAHAGPG